MIFSFMRQPMLAAEGEAGAAPAAVVAAEPAAAVPAPAAVVESVAAPAAIPAAEPAAPAAPAVEAPPAPVEAAPAPAKDFAPSLLDEGAKAPTVEPKPGEAPAAAPVEGQPPAAKEPAVEAKPGEKPPEAKPEPPAPIEYQFVYPEDVKPAEADKELVGAFTGILNEVRVPPEAAQKLFNLHIDAAKKIAAEVEKRVSERQWETFESLQKDWREAVLSDAELGGARHKTAINTVLGLIDAFSLRDQSSGRPRSSEAIAAERQRLLDVGKITGIANNPDWLRLLHWAGDRLTREPAPRPAPPPRSPSLNSQQRGLRRYQGTTPSNG